MQSQCDRSGGPAPCVFRTPILLAGNWNKNTMKFTFFNTQSIPVAKTGKMRTRRVLILALAVGLAVLSTASMNIESAHAGKPVPPPPLPPVRFQLTIAPTSIPVVITGMNDFGELVGIYNNSAGRGSSACIVKGAEITFLENIVAAPAGWYYGGANAINNTGSIVGYMYSTNPDITIKHGFVIHRPLGLPAYVKEIPDSGLGQPVYLDAINDDGVLVGTTWDPITSASRVFVYDTQTEGSEVTLLGINMRGFIGINNAPFPKVFGCLRDGNAFIYTLGGTLETPPYPNILAMNDQGAYCGRFTQTINRQTYNIAYRYSTWGGAQTFSDAKGGASEINEHGDMIFGNIKLGSEVQLYSQGLGTLNLGSLVVGNATEVSLFRNNSLLVRGLTERGSLNPFMPGFPAIGGVINGTNILVPFTLTPVAP